MHKDDDDKGFLIQLVDLWLKIALIDAIQIFRNVGDEQENDIGFATHDSCIRGLHFFV